MKLRARHQNPARSLMAPAPDVSDNVGIGARSPGELDIAAPQVGQNF
jgi:hypothetical protein